MTQEVATNIWMGLCIVTMLIFVIPGMIGASKFDKKDDNR